MSYACLRSAIGVQLKWLEQLLVSVMYVTHTWAVRAPNAQMKL